MSCGGGGAGHRACACGAAGAARPLPFAVASLCGAASHVTVCVYTKNALPVFKPTQQRLLYASLLAAA